MANYYVSSTVGSGGTGTLLDPWKLGDLLTGSFTPGVALTTLAAGDTLYFRGGTYTIADTADNSGNVHIPYIRPTSSGTAPDPITLRPYPGESVTIARTAQSGGGIQRVLIGPVAGAAVNHVRWLGFKLQLANDTKAGHLYCSEAIDLDGTGNEIGYCEIVGTTLDSTALTDNQCGIFVEPAANQCRVHHCDFHGFHGVLFHTQAITSFSGGAGNIYEDNYFHDCDQAGIEKGAVGAANGAKTSTWRRNWLKAPSGGWIGNAAWQGEIETDGAGVYTQIDFYDNVVEGSIAPNGCQSGSRYFNNLFTGLGLNGSDDILFGLSSSSAYASKLSEYFNNVALSATGTTDVFGSSVVNYVASGGSATFAYLDNNVYAGTSALSYAFAAGSRTLGQMHADNWELSSGVVADLDVVYADSAGGDYTLLSPYGTSGRYADKVGPRVTISGSGGILDATRYGPAALTPAPGNTVSAFVGTSRKVLFFRLNDGTPADIWVSQASDPTYTVNDGDPIALTDRTAYATGFNNPGSPYVSYPIAAVLQSDVLAFSADAGWVSFGDGETAPEAVNEPVTNWSGIEMFPIAESKTLKLGMNFSAPHPVVPVDILRNMLSHTNGGGGLISFDNNFIPTEIDDEVWYNTSNRVTGNGYNDRGTGGVVGTHWVTWDDYSVGRDKLAWLAEYDAANVLLAAVGPKLTIATTGSYTRYRQQFDIRFAPGRTTDSLAFKTYWNSVDVKNVEVVGPGEDPDSTEILNGYVKRVLTGVSNYRFMQSGPGLDSNIAIHAHCRQSADLSVEMVHYQEAQLIQVEAIPATTIRWNGETFVVDKFTVMFPGTDPTYFVGLLCTTASPHGFYTLQNLDLRGVYNNDYANPGDATNHCGVQIDGLSGPVWMGFGGQSQVICYVVNDTQFICYPGFVVATAGVADPIGVQGFDISAGRSIVSTFFPRNGNISYGDQIQMAAEGGARPQLHISECMTDQGAYDVAVECRDKMVALGDNAPEFLYFALANENWNSSWSAFNRITALSKVINQNVDRGIVVGASRQCHAYLAGRLLGIIKGVFDDAGMGNRVKRLIEFQRYGDTELQYAFDHGLTFEAGGPSAYYFSTFPAGSWDAYTDPGQIHDLWQWMLHYLVVGQQDAMLAIVAEFMPGMEIVAYEGGEDQFTPGPTYDAALMLDWYYNSRNEHTTEMTFENAQRAGFDVLNLFQFQGGIRTDAGTLWQHSMGNAQEPGLGLSPPNWTVAELSGDDNLDLHNQNPKLLAVDNWATNTPTPTPTILIPGVASLGTRTTTSIAMSATNATGGTPPYSYRWQISTDSGSTWNPATGTGVTTLSTTITGLTPGTSYQIRLQYTDSGT